MEFPLWPRGSEASWEAWFVGLTLGPAQWVKDLGLWQLCGLGCECRSDLISGLGIPYAMGRPKVKNKQTNHVSAGQIILQERFLRTTGRQVGI